MPASFLEFLLAALVMEITPGPNMTWLALLAAREGRIAGMMAVAGIATGLALLALVTASGAAAIVTAWPPLYEALRWGGVLFLLYLAFEAWVGERKSITAASDRNFRRGLLINLLNPKAAAVFLVMIPSFAGPAPTQASVLVVMNVVYLAIATTAHALIVLFAASFQKALADPARELVVRRIFAACLGAIAIWFAATSGHVS